MSRLMPSSLLSLSSSLAAAVAVTAEASGDPGVAFFCRVCYCCPAIPSHLMAALAFTSTTAPETAARAPLLSPLMEVALQRQGGWCCDEKLTTCFR